MTYARSAKRPTPSPVDPVTGHVVSHAVSHALRHAVSHDLCTHIQEHLANRLPAEAEFPTGIHRAMRHAVLKGGKRLRSRLLIMVARAARTAPLQDAEVALVLDAVCAMELAHAASLVHDDLPCFDNAQLRRGQPTVHMAFGEPLAILTGDALLTLAFEVLSMAPPAVVGRAMRILNVLARSIGTRAGMIGGQSLELDWSRYCVDAELPAVSRYHHMKTGALFRAATEAGAMAVGVDDAQAWGRIGLLVGQLYQMTDDLYDVVGDPQHAQKALGQDARHGRPNAALASGVKPLLREMQALIDDIGQQVAEVAEDQTPLIHFIDELRAFTMGRAL